MHRLARALWGALALAACERSPLPPPAAPAVPVPAAAPSPPPEPAPAAPPAAPPEVGPVPLVRAGAVAGGAEVALARDGEAVVDPASLFRVEVAAPLADARLSLFDAQEALVPCESTAEVGTTATRIVLAPASPLRPGSRYTLRIEGAASRELHDLSGRAYLPVTLALRASGEPRAAERGAGTQRRRGR